MMTPKEHIEEAEELLKDTYSLQAGALAAQAQAHIMLADFKLRNPFTTEDDTQTNDSEELDN